MRSGLREFPSTPMLLLVLIVPVLLEILLDEWRLHGEFRPFTLCATRPYLCVSFSLRLQIIASLSFLRVAIASLPPLFGT
jgi:hypothetical protein